jgi:excinuclease ABC subunit A
VLHRALLHALGQGGDASNLYRELSGVQYLNDVVLVDQSPIGRTPRSNPVTYIKAFDAIRELFAAQPDARRKRLTAGSFSFNVPGGRCDVCEGDGTVTVEMQFLADVELPCEECNGTRYKASILEVKYKGTRRSWTSWPFSMKLASATCGWVRARRRSPAARRSV